MLVLDNDAVLICKTAEGDATAFDVLWRRYTAALARIIRTMTADRDEADDILQETGIRAFVALNSGKYHHQGKFLAWLCRIARNAVIDRHRSGIEETPLWDEIQDTRESRSAESLAVVNLLVSFLYREIADVFGSNKDRDPPPEGQLRILAFMLYYRDGYTLQEVHEVLSVEAERAGLSTPTVTAINNWLAGGRLMKTLIQHLVEAHPEMLDKLSDDALILAKLSAPEERAWHSGAAKPPAAGVSLLADDTRWLASARQKITGALTVEILRAIHEARLSS